MGVAAAKGWIITGKGAVKAWVSLLFLGYVALRVLLRLLIGKRRREWVQDVLGIHYTRGYSVKYGSLLPWYEADVRRIIKNVLSKPHSQTFIDIGAYVGWHTVTAYRILRKRKVFKIVAVEPDPNNYRQLEKDIGGFGGIWLVNEAVSVSDGEEIDFHRGTAGRVDLIKMDIEGAEYPVLTDPSLDLSRVENMVVEVHYRYGSRESQEIIRALAKHGFKIVSLYPDTTSRYYHLLACRGEVPW